MLQAIRSKVGSWIVKILFFFLILSFAVWGIGDLFRDRGPAQVVAEVGDIEIDVQTLDAEYRRQVQRLQQVLGPELTAQTALAMGVMDQALEETIRQALYAATANDLGLSLPDALVAEEVRRQEVFHDEVTGRFDRQRFLAVLAASGLTEQGYVQLLARDLNRQMLTQTVAAGAAAPGPLVDALYRYRNEERVGSTVAFDAADVTEVPEPSGDDLAAFHQENADRFTAPEYREFTVVALTAEDLAEEIVIDEDLLREEYDLRMDFFQRNEQRSFDQVVLEDQETAQAVAEAARGGAGLAEAVDQVGVEAPVIPLDLGTREDLPFDQLAEAGFALEGDGAVSDPVETPFGWHVMKLTGLEEAGIAPFEAVRGDIQQELQLDLALDAVFEMANQLEDELAGGATLEQAANALGLDPIDVPAVARDGSVRGDAALPDLPAEEQVIETAFATQAGELAPMQETREGDFYIVRVDGVIPPELRPLDDVRDAVRSAWEQAQRREIAAARAAQAAERLSLGGAPAEVAAALGGSAGTTPPVTRDGGGEDELPAGLPAALFELAPGQADVVAAGDRRIAVRLDDVLPADPGQAGDALAELRRQLARGISQDLVDQFAAALRAREGVTVDQAALDRYLRQVEG